LATLMNPLNLQASARDLKIGLFIPCYIDMIYPKVGIATLELLERFGLKVDYVHGAQGPRSLNVFFLPRSGEV
jgi:Fe-S oxidoreductase